MAVLCPECETPVVIDVDEMEEGDTIACEDCGSELELVSIDPPRVTLVDASGYDDPEDPLMAASEEEDDE